MTKVLITGATGNVGQEVIKSLQKMDHHLELFAGVREVNADNTRLANYKIKLIQFDFIDSST